MTEKLTSLQLSAEQITAALQGDDSHVTTHVVSLKPVPDYDADAIKAIREKLGITQRVLAFYVAVSPRTVKSWEAGKSHPSKTARRLIQSVQSQPNILKLVFQ
ncbi:XRE family transcriptional regulator [Lactiplantibacillus fabifermentans T30PCM01]|uniref:XRE family transcriptional regulator n=1 Tax=Lactiplantibacillus fabifermentans T30PCM01 TaxID=1400520 RepID=W6T8P8_9LACO|nr:helix-turn-helix domain-containing protein [Lactiplantibacillus fabifermentans]ETY74722.1 XRE family transcriptional regulator [Lactiplantibacillus fabifermentans T30PCM01]